MNTSMNSEKWNSWLLSEFQWFHAHPELSDEEFATTARLRENLEKMDI